MDLLFISPKTTDLQSGRLRYPYHIIATQSKKFAPAAAGKHRSIAAWFDEDAHDRGTREFDLLQTGATSCFL
jgi:hypothetical protein